MGSLIQDILGPQGAIARRLGERYDYRPQQLEMAAAVERALAEPSHLMVEAGTGVGKSFAYLLPAIDFAVRNRKRVVISTHTISLQEQLIDKDIPLIQSVYPDEFTAVLVKGRSNYICQRRLGQAGQRMYSLFDETAQQRSLQVIEQWAATTTDGSLADLPEAPEPGVWDKVCAEHGNCLGKRCQHYQHCHWQAAKRRMQGGKILIVNHALFFSDLALRAAGVNYLPKYDAVILDEAHTVEDVAGSHFGLEVGERGLRYQLRTLYDPKRGKGLLSAFGAVANSALEDVEELHFVLDQFFSRCLQWQQQFGRPNGRVNEPGWVENDVSPKLRELALHVKAMVAGMAENQEDASELASIADRVGMKADMLDAIVGQSMEDAVYWIESPTARMGPPRVTLRAAPVCVADGLKRQLFERVKSVVMTSATLCTAAAKGTTATAAKPAAPRANEAAAAPAASPDGDHGRGARATGDGPRDARGMGAPPVSGAPVPAPVVRKREGAYLPHWTKDGAIYAVTFRLADALPAGVTEAWRVERDGILQRAKEAGRELTRDEVGELRRLHTDRIESLLDAGHGQCWLRKPEVAALLQQTLDKFDKQRYHLLAWCIMPNHVHLVVRPKAGVELSQIMHSLKSWTAKEANRVLRRTGEFWQAEYYDHLIRDEQDLAHSVRYAFENPEKAGWRVWRWRGKAQSLIEEMLADAPVGEKEETSPDGDHGRGAHATLDEGAPRGTGASPVAAEGRSAPQPDIIPTPDLDQSPAAFAYIRSRLGVEKAHTLLLGSPFDYERQATLYVENDLPEPNDPLFLAAACNKITRYLGLTNGGAFVLFTSYGMLRGAVEKLRPTIASMKLPLLVQGEGQPPRVLLERFRTTANAVLFGTSSFWQGIDVQGDALRNVILVKLPFAVPDEPIVEARLDDIKRRGGNPFMEYSVPEAIIKMKQGFGRLIRSRTDTGIVVILDSRVTTKRYGRLFLDALPGCRRIVVRG